MIVRCRAATGHSAKLTVCVGWLFFGWREYPAYCLESCGPLSPHEASGDDPDA